MVVLIVIEMEETVVDRIVLDIGVGEDDDIR